MMAVQVSEEWQTKSLGELVEFLDHMRVPVKQSDREKRRGPYPYYGANGQVDWIDGYIFDEPLVLLAEDGGFYGSKEHPIAYKIEGKSWVNNHAHVLRPVTRLIDLDYLHWFLSFRDVNPFLSGSTRPKLTKSDASRIPVRFPKSLDTQKLIARIIGHADNLRKWRSLAKQITSQVIRSLFLEMFGNPATSSRGWEFRRVSDLCEVIMGQSPPSSTYNTEGNGLPFFQGKFEFGEMYPEVKKWCSEPLKIAEKGDILMTVRAPVGPVNRNRLRSCIGRGLCAIRPEKMNSLFLFYQLKFLEERISGLGVGSTFQAITKTQVENLEIINPPIPLQAQFASNAQRLEAVKEKQTQSETEIDELFHSIMHRAFTGELAIAKSDPSP